MNTDLEKKVLRRELSQRRDGIPEVERRRADGRIFSLLISSREYREAGTLLCYIASRSEPGTRTIIEDALSSGKTAACPRCTDGDGHMAFYYIDSLSGLVPGRFGIPEPDPAICRAYDGRDALCIVPGLSFDAGGGRLGYGKGYYDRFLADFGGTSVGLCYERMLSEKLPRGEYDRRTDMIVTEERVIHCI